MPYEKELKKLMYAGTETMLGGIHWGLDNDRWYRNDVATTVTAFSVLEKEPGYANSLKSITYNTFFQKSVAAIGETPWRLPPLSTAYYHLC